MLNWELLKPRNLVVVAAIALVFRAITAPILNSLDKKG